MDFNIRRADLIDCKTIYRLLNQLHHDHLEYSRFTILYEGHLRDILREYWVIEEDSKVIGFACIVIQNPIHLPYDRYLIEEFTIDEHYRNQRFGTMLLQFVLQKYKDKDKELFRINSGKSIKELKFYKQNGFHPSHVCFRIQ